MNVCFSLTLFFTFPFITHNFLTLILDITGMFSKQSAEHALKTLLSSGRVSVFYMIAERPGEYGMDDGDFECIDTWFALIFHHAGEKSTVFSRYVTLVNLTELAEALIFIV